MTKHIVIDGRIRQSSTGRYVDRLLAFIQDIDTDNTYTIMLKPGDNWQPHAGNFKTIECPFPQFSINPLTELKFARFVRKLNADLVHFTMTQQPLFYFGKTVTTSHDTTMYRFARPTSNNLIARFLYGIKNLLYRFLVWWSHRKTKKIIVPTETVAKEFAQLQPFTKNKLVVTLEGADVLPVSKTVKPDYIDGPFIFYVGSSFPHKNLPRLVAAFEKVLAVHPDVKLLLVGKVEKHKQKLIEYIQTKSYRDSIVTPGFVPDEELLWLYQNCEAYIFPTLSEGFGLPSLEAMASGAPVACSNASCLPEVNGNAAAYFDPLDLDSMANTINSIIKNPTKQDELRKLGYEQVKNFSWKRMAEQTHEVYSSTL